MGKDDFKGDAFQPSGRSDTLAAFYLTEDTGLPCNVKDYHMALYKGPDFLGALVERRALRVTFAKNTSIEQPCHLLTFGSDDQRCNVVLLATEASPVHCKVYAQLNSGQDIWVIEDLSNNGTEYLDDHSMRTLKSKSVVGGRVALNGLRRIKIGRNVFSFWSPADGGEVSERGRWFQNLDPMLVTQAVLRDQLRGAAEEYSPILQVAKGGFGKVFKYMEKTTGLMIAVKEEKVEVMGQDERIQKEIGYMQSLKHVSQTTILI